MVKEYGYEYNALTDEQLLSRTGWSGTDETLWGAHCLRSGRDALKVVAREHPNTTVFLPSLCCDSMITPFEAYGCDVVFYPLTRDITVDFSALTEELQRCNGQGLLLFYDYFGIPMFSPNQFALLKKRFGDLILVKDITHTLLREKDSEPSVDYTIASLRKWTNIPDGGLLWTNRKLNPLLLSEDHTFAEQRLCAQCLRTAYFETGDETVKTRYRKLFSHVSSLLDEDPSPIKMTEYSYQSAIRTDWSEIRSKRRENAEVLTEFFSGNENLQILNAGIMASDLYLPITVKNQDTVQKILSSKGIFNTVIWPLRETQTAACPTAKYITEHMLAVPCDQRYTKDDMSYIGTEIARIVNE